MLNSKNSTTKLQNNIFCKFVSPAYSFGYFQPQHFIDLNTNHMRIHMLIHMVMVIIIIILLIAYFMYVIAISNDYRFVPTTEPLKKLTLSFPTKPRVLKLVVDYRLLVIDY